MFVILAYDVKEKRCNQFHRICSKFLLSKQKSIFVGEITENRLNTLVEMMKEVIKDKDKVTIYKLPSRKYLVCDDYGLDDEIIVIQ